MTYTVIYEARVRREDFPKIPEVNKPQIERAIRERLTVAPDLLGKPLTGGFAGMRRLRVGDWRIIYEVEAETVTVHAIKIRRDAYKGLPPKF